MNKWSRELKGEVEGQTKKLCVLVVGMHRSGTSALTRTLNLLGCDLPHTLMGETASHEASNPAGHWESAAIAAFNDRILASAGTTWRDCQPFSSAWYASPRFGDFKAQAQEILAAEFGSSNFFVLKDPRISKLLPFWLDALETFDVEPLVASIVRNPAEVSASLEVRNGLDPSYCELLWLRYVLDGEEATRGVRRAHVAYDDLLSDWRGLCGRLGDQLGLVWPRLSGSVASEVDAFLDPQLRHHRSSAREIRSSSSQWVKETGEVLARWTQEGEDAEGRAALDAVRASFNGVLRDTGRAIEAGGRAMANERKHNLQNQQLRNQLARIKQAAEGAANTAASQLAALADRLEQADADHARSKAVAATLTARLTGAQEELERERSDRVRSEGEAAAADLQLKARSAEIAEISRKLSAARQSAANAGKELEQRQTDLARLATEIGVLKDRIAWADAEIARRCAAEEGHLADLREARDRIVEREAEIARRALEAERQAIEFDRLRARLGEAEVSLERRLIETQNYASELAVMRGRNAQLEADLLRNVDRVAALTGDLAVARERLDVARRNIERSKKQFDGELRRARERSEAEARARAAEIEQLQNTASARALALADREAELNALRQELQRLSVRRWLGRFLPAGRPPTSADRPAVDPEAVSLVAGSDLFDADWYRARDPALADAASAAEHYVVLGGAQGRPASPRFDSALYLSAHTDVRENGLNPLVHYLRHGRDEGREIFPFLDTSVDRQLVAESDLFDAAGYLAENPDVAAAGLDPLEHFLLHGAKEGRRASAKFDTVLYLAANPDVAEAGLNPLVHYLRHGRDEGRALAPPQPMSEGDSSSSAADEIGRFAEDQALIAASGLFDPAWYASQGVPPAGVDPIIHYLTVGTREGRDPGPTFDTRGYLAANPDVKEAGLNPLVHYIRFGRNEGRRGAPKRVALAEPAPRTVAKTKLPPARPPEERLWTRSADLAPREGLAVLSIHGATLGLWPEEAMTAPEALGGFLRLARLPVAGALALRSAQGEAPGPELPADAAAVLDDDLAGLARLADLWFTNDHGLRLRIDGSAHADGCVIRLYQADPATAGRPILVGEAPVFDGALRILDAALVNPYAPVLIAVTTADGVLAGANLLQFPSLIRGGAHAAESVAIAGGGFPGLRSVSNALAQEHLGWAEAKPSAIGTIEVDLRGASGAERIFSSPFKVWLAQTMGVRLRARPAEEAAETTTHEHLEAELAQDLDRAREDFVAAREASGELTLTLPPDALPTLAALVSRRLCAPAGERPTTASYLVADQTTCAPRFAVSIPPLGEDLMALQPADLPLCFPLLRGRSGAVGRSGGEAALAIRYRQPPTPHQASLLAPISFDAPRPVLRTSLPKRQRKGVSVLLAPTGDGQAFARLLESLALQTYADKLELVVALAAGAEADTLRQALEASFPDRHRIIESAGQSRSGRLNAAAAAAKGAHLLVAGDTVLLTDPRTIETLYLMAADKTVATAACMIVREGFKKGAGVRFHSGGFYPSHLSFQSAPRMIFNEPESLSAFPTATYPVAGNSLRLALVRADAWRALAGLDASMFPGSNADLDFSLRALAAGYRHLCTSAVAAVDTSGEAGRDHVSEVLDSAPQALDWRTILSSASIIRRLD